MACINAAMLALLLLGILTFSIPIRSIGCTEERGDFNEFTINFSVPPQFDYYKRLDTIKEKGDIQIIELSDDERAKFEEKAKSVRDTYVNDVGERGQASLDALLSAIEENKSASDSQ